MEKNKPLDDGWPESEEVILKIKSFKNVKSERKRETEREREKKKK